MMCQSLLSGKIKNIISLSSMQECYLTIAFQLINHVLGKETKTNCQNNIEYLTVKQPLLFLY